LKFTRFLRVAWLSFQKNGFPWESTLISRLPTIVELLA
jgi:hypothetical protein